MSCALGISQLKRLAEFQERRDQVAAHYREFLGEIEEIKLPPYQMDNAHMSWFLYVIQLKNRNRQQRDQFIQYLRTRGVACSDYFAPIHLQPYFQELGYSRVTFPVTEKISKSTVALPFFNDLKEDEIRYIADVIRQGLCEQALTQQSSHSMHSPVPNL